MRENDASANCGRGGCSGAILGYFEYEQYVRAQTASFSVCVDPEDLNGWSTCTTPGVSSGPVQIDLKCQCNDPTKDVESCPADCPFGNKRFCPLRKVHRSRASFCRSARALCLTPTTRGACGAGRRPELRLVAGFRSPAQALLAELCFRLDHPAAPSR